MARDDLPERVAGIAALADPIRHDLYLYVSAQPAPVSRDQASEALRIACHTAKFHLDKLAEEGLLDTDSNASQNVEAQGPAGPPSCTSDPADSCRLRCLNADTTSPPSCLFDMLAREHTQLVCGMNLTMLAAVTDRVSRAGLAARFEPAPDRCCVVLDAD